jgi:hypothetical protein
MEDTMTTPRIRSLVSGLAYALTIAGCASAPARLASDAASPSTASPLTVRFDNDARDYVHVYLIGLKREWLLGRVEPGAHATLRIPDAAVAEDAGTLQLAVLTGARVTYHAAGDARATMTLAQPAGAFLVQRWSFSTGSAKGQLTALPIARAQR